MPRVHLIGTRSLPTLALMLALVVASAMRLAAVEPLRTYPTLTLKDGRQLTEVEVINYTSDGVFIRYAGGLTMLRAVILPDAIAADLHLKPSNAALVPFDPSLANRPAIGAAPMITLADQRIPATPSNDDLANRPAVAAALPAATTAASEPVDSTPALPSATAPASSDVAIAETTAEVTEGPTPAGEGNLPEFFTTPPAVPAPAPVAAPTLHGGRIAVGLPTGETCLLADVEIKAYPTDVLARYLAETKARCAAMAEESLAEAAKANAEGRSADAANLAARARNLVAHYLDYLPAAAVTVRSDRFGFFTLPAGSERTELELVAAGRATSAQGLWNYEWVGVPATTQTLLTESNATSVAAPIPADSKYAAR